MPTQTTTNLAPQINSLVVCAGTVTCSSVGYMGSGFNVFQKIFKDGIACDNDIIGHPSNGGWKTKLQKHITSYRAREADMPSYIRVAQHETFIGGVATVPHFSEKKSLHKHRPQDDVSLKTEYKNAVYMAVVDAKTLNRPLYIQPLGIGVYAWPPADAAKIFVEAIMEADPEDIVDITIPIFAYKSADYCSNLN